MICLFSGFKPSTNHYDSMWSPDSRNVQWNFPMSFRNSPLYCDAIPTSGGRFWGNNSRYILQHTSSFAIIGSVWFDDSYFNDVHSGMFFAIGFWK
ncbi:MAG: hypothetical protein ACRCWI_08540 [Brevinema sp.]